MSLPSPDKIWNATQNDLDQLLNSKKLLPQHRKVHFFAPSFAYYKTASFCNSPVEFPTISITGNVCALNCKHCGGKVLETMHPAATPDKLLSLCSELKQKGALGVLVSGGCLPDGSVPLQRFIPALYEIKHVLDLTVFVHTGIVDSTTAMQLKSAGIDAALIDVIGSDETIREIYNLRVSIAHFKNSIKALHEANLAFVPHITVGLHQGELKGEFAALNMIKVYEPSAIVVISFMPIRGTAMYKTKPPTPHDIARVVATTRAMFPLVPVVLGCMRPKGKHRAETDVLALKAGAEGVAFPSQEAIRFSRRERFEVTFSRFCCAQVYKDIS